VFFWRADLGPVEIAITDRRVDLLDPDDFVAVSDQLHLDWFASMRQVHGSRVAWVKDSLSLPMADALATMERGVGVVVQVADCVPVVLVSPDGFVAAVHAGRRGLVAGVAPAAVKSLRARGAGEVEAWIGPHICGRCYELPGEMVDEVSAVVPEAKATTSWGTPAADLGAGVRAQLAGLGVAVHDVGVCTYEDDRFFSYRRGDKGRFGAVVVRR
jgi:YfiH family protein